MAELYNICIEESRYASSGGWTRLVAPEDKNILAMTWIVPKNRQKTLSHATSKPP
ncbi:hypothetical protein TWF751_001312, partial [Orbilia oligospora]